MNERAEKIAARTMEEAPPTRVLGLFDATCVVIGAIIGVGIFFTPRNVAVIAGSPGVAIGAWALGGVIALLGALSFAGIGRVYHGNGAQYAALRDAWGPMPAFLYVFCNATAIQAGAIAIIAVICVRHAGDALAGAAPEGVALVALSVALVLGLACANVLGVRWGSRIQNLTVVAKVGTLAAIAAAAVFFAPAERATEAMAHGRDEWLVVLLFAAVVPAFFSYGGWQHALWIAGEVKEPRRVLPLAIVGGVVVVMLVYVATAWAFFRLLGQAGVEASNALAADAVRQVWPGAGGRVVAGAVAVSAFGVLNAQLLSGPRLVQGMARDGRFFAPFGRVHRRFGTPDWSIWLLALIAVGLLLTAGFEGVDRLLSGVVFVDGVFFALTGAAAMVLAKRGVRVWGGRIVPALFVIGEAGIVLGAARGAGWWSLAIVGWIVAAGALYVIYFRK